MFTYGKPIYLVLLTSLSIFFSVIVHAKPVASGQAFGHSFTVEEVITDQGAIWSLTFISDSELLFTERSGQLKKLNLTTGKIIPITGLPAIYAEGQGGLLDIKAAPDFKENQWIYFTYSKPTDKNGATTLARAQLNGLQLDGWQDLLVTQASNDTTRHFGSRIAFDDNGHVYFTVGDRGHRPNGQDLSTHAGAVLRLTLEGLIPATNPFLEQPDAQAAIWSYGHRNPQGIAFDSTKQQLWSIEHGPRGGDEINLIQEGNNYGWPVVSQGQEYWAPLDVGTKDNQQGMTEPKKVYIPSIAPSSLAIYRGNAFPRWQGHLFSGALRGQHLNVVSLDEVDQPQEEQRLLAELNERIRSVTTGPDGFIYLSTDSGRLLVMRPASSS